MREIKFFVVAALLVLQVSAFAQSTLVYPDEYESALQAARDKYKIAMFQGWDVVLPPEEQVGLLANPLTLATGNWGPEFMGINARQADILKAAKRKVAIFIIDTGDGYKHPLLKNVAWNEKGKDFTGASADGDDLNGHSTHCAGIIAASDPNTPLGAARVLGDAGWVKVIPYQALSDAGSGSFSWIKTAILSAVQEGKLLQQSGWAVGISMSLGGTVTTPPADIESALKSAQDAGFFVVVAAGNTGALGVQYPGKSQYVNAIAALQQVTGGVNRAPYSTFGPEVFIAAPGSGILSTYKGALASLSGTSMATPHEAAIYAILMSINSNATAAAIKAHIQKYAKDLDPGGKDDYTGYGVSLINQLLDNAVSGTPPPPPPPDTTPVAKRLVNIKLEDLTNNWRNYSSGTMQQLYFSYILSVETNLSDEAIADKIKASAKDLYSRSGLVLNDGDGFAAAAYYTGRFAEILFKQQYGLNVTCLEIWGADKDYRQTVWRKGDTKPSQAKNKMLRASCEVGAQRMYLKKR